MVDQVIHAESSTLTDQDRLKRDLVKELIQSQNQRIVDYAKNLVTVSFAAIGVVLTFKEKWLGSDVRFDQRVLLGFAIILFLATGVVATLAASMYIHRVNLVDYTTVDDELNRVAKIRFKLTCLAFSLSAVATIFVVLVAL